MRAIFFLMLSVFFSVAATAKMKISSLPEFRARFKTKNTYKEQNTFSDVNVDCFLGKCWWKEVVIDRCFSNTSSLHLFYFPGVFIYSTLKSDVSDKMTVKQNSDKTISISLYNYRDEIISKYLLKIECPKIGMWVYPYCKVLSLKGSTVDEELEVTIHHLVTLGNAGSIKMDRCQ